jgi:hypothetical protein
MGFRFRKSVTILPGVRINLGKSGVSTTLGGRGRSVTVGKRGTHANVGLPGTGLSYRERLDLPGGRVQRARGGSRVLAALFVGFLLLWVLGALFG